MFTSASLLLLATLLNGQDSDFDFQHLTRGRKNLLQLAGKTFHTTPLPVSNLRVIPASDRTATLLWTEQSSAKKADMAAITVDGKTVAKTLQIDYSIPLHFAKFDPLQSVPALPTEWTAKDCNLIIVQCYGQPLPEYVEQIQKAGGEFLRFLPETSFICDASVEVISTLRELPFVRWVGPYEPAYRTFPEFLTAELPTQNYVIELTRTSALTKALVADQVWLSGGIVMNHDAGTNLIEAVLTNDQFKTILNLPDVFFASPKGEPGEDMNVARSISNVTAVNSAFGFEGQGVRGEVMDGNLRVTHDALDTSGRTVLVHTAGSGSQSHGSSTTGIVFGNGTANTTGTGILVQGQPIFAGYSNFGGGNRYTHTQQLVASPYFAVFQSNSWGNPQVTSYTSISQEMDSIIFNTGLLILNSQSNTGNNTSRPEAWAKNVLSIGGIWHGNTSSRSDDTWTSASYGPAADGRVKPDIAHFYDAILCPTSGSDTAYTSSFGGTSGATPIVAGLSGLLFQMWAEGVFGQTNLTPRSPSNRFVFDSRCKFTTLKALLINHAYQYDMATTNLTRFRQGWGMPDLGVTLTNRNRMLIVDEADRLTNLQAKSYKVYVPAGTPDFRATMTYMDLPGTTSSSEHRINDVSLRVTSPSNQVYFGNNGLTNSRWSVTGGTFDTKNTVENVFIQNPAAGTWTVEVIASTLIVDAVVETPGVIDADYALVVTGCAPTAVATSVTAEGCAFAGGDVTSVETSNEQKLIAQWNASPRFDGLTQYSVQFSGSCPVIAPLNSLQFRIEEQCNLNGIGFRIELFDFNANQWESQLTGTSSSTEQARTVTPTNPNRFVHSGSQEVRARVVYFTDPMLLTSIQSSIDQARWFFTPQ